MKWPFFNKKKYKPTQPTVVKSPYNYSGGTTITPDSAMQVSAFYSGVMYISTSVAKLPWRVKDSDNKKIHNNIETLLNTQPNKEMDAMSFRLVAIQTAIVFGNFYAEIERDLAGRIVALWPLPPQYVQAYRMNSGELVYRVIGGALTYQGDAFLQLKDIFHLPNFITKDGINGQGVAAYCAETLGIAAGADRFANSLFANGGMPSGTLEAPGTLSAEAQTRIVESWKTANGGRKTGGTALLEEGLKYNPISFDPQVMQFLESREFSVVEIARFLRVPPTKLYALAAAKFNNIEQENLAVATDTLSSWCRRLELQADIKLLNAGIGGRHSELDLNDLFRGDMDTRSNYFVRMMSVGAISPNEIREKEGAESYTGGDEYYIATNNYTPVSRMNEVIDSQIKAKEAPKVPEEEPKKEEPSEVDNAVVDFLRSRK